MNKIILFSFFLTCILLFLLLVIRKLNPKKTVIPEEKIHYHAGFVVFENNKKLDFSDMKYMYLKPCSVRGNGATREEDTKLEKAHLHDNIGDLVHVEAKNAFWRDLFTNIQFPIEYSKTTGYINGKKIQNFQKQPIRPYDSLIIFIGENDEKLLDQGVTREYIETQSKKSVECGD